MRTIERRERITEQLIYAVYGDRKEEYTHCFVSGAAATTQAYYMRDYAKDLNIPEWLLPTAGSVRRAKNRLVAEGRAFLVDKGHEGPKGFILKGHVPKDVLLRLTVAAAHRLHNSGLPVMESVMSREIRNALSFTYQG